MSDNDVRCKAFSTQDWAVTAAHISKAMSTPLGHGKHVSTSQEDEIDEDIDLDDLFESKKVTKEGKRTKRYLKKLEGKGDYETDEEEENPYVSEVPLTLAFLIIRRKQTLKRNR